MRLIRGRSNTIMMARAGALLATVLAVNCAAAPANAQRGVTVTLADTLFYDDNIYRVPEFVDDFDTAIGPGSSREDWVNNARVGAQLHGGAGQQEFLVRGRFEDIRYRDNDMLDHHAGNGLGKLDWRLGRRWSGTAGAEYDRRLAGFANTLFRSKDVLSRRDYFGSAKFELTPRWDTEYSARYSETDHSADAQEGQNSETHSWSGALNYTTPAQSKWSVDYRGGQTRFPEQGPLQRNAYDDSGWGVGAVYPVSVKTLLKARVGYTRRNYLDSGSGDFSGTVGEASMRWLSTAKTSFDVSLYRKLKAYIEAETEYFVSDGAELQANWQPSVRLGVVAKYLHEKNDYRGSQVSSGDRRRDTLDTAGIAVSYVPIDALTLTLGWNFEDRNSNRAVREYRDNLISISASFSF